MKLIIVDCAVRRWSFGMRLVRCSRWLRIAHHHRELVQKWHAMCENLRLHENEHGWWWRWWQQWRQPPIESSDFDGFHHREMRCWVVHQLENREKWAAADDRHLSNSAGPLEWHCSFRWMRSSADTWRIACNASSMIPEANFIRGSQRWVYRRWSSVDWRWACSNGWSRQICCRIRFKRWHIRDLIWTTMSIWDASKFEMLARNFPRWLHAKRHVPTDQPTDRFFGHRTSNSSVRLKSQTYPIWNLSIYSRTEQIRRTGRKQENEKCWSLWRILSQMAHMKQEKTYQSKRCHMIRCDPVVRVATAEHCCGRHWRRNWMIEMCQR